MVIFARVAALIYDAYAALKSPRISYSLAEIICVRAVLMSVMAETPRASLLTPSFAFVFIFAFAFFVGGGGRGDGSFLFGDFGFAFEGFGEFAVAAGV